MKRKSNINKWIEAFAGIMFSGLFQAIAIIVIFGILGVCGLIAAFLNPVGGVFIAAMCATLVLFGILEYKKYKQ